MGFAEAAGILWTGIDPVTSLREERATRNPHPRTGSSHRT